MGEHADGVAGPELRPDLLQETVGPVHDDLIGVREPLFGSEDGAGVAHRDPIAEDLGHPGEGRSEVDRAEDQHAGRRGERLDEDRDLVLAGLALRPVMADTGCSGRKLPPGVTDHNPVEIVVAERADRIGARLQEDLGPHQGDVVTFGRFVDGHDRGQSHRLFGRDGGPQEGEQGVGHEALPVEGFEIEVNGSTAGQADGERLVVGVPERHDTPGVLLETLE